MIYDSLDTLPVKTFYKILETNNLRLLSNGHDRPDSELELIFDKLSEEFQELSSEDKSDRNFMITKEISHLESKYRTAICGIEILRFELNATVLQELEKLLNVRIRTNLTEYYYKDLERAESKANLIKKMINKLKDQLPTKQNSRGGSIDDTLATISMITGVSFDFNLISCTAYYALLNQANQKAKAQEQALNELKSK